MSLYEDLTELEFKVGAPALADFWQENFKVQVGARTGNFYILPGGTSVIAPLIPRADRHAR